MTDGSKYEFTFTADPRGISSCLTCVKRWRQAGRTHYPGFLFFFIIILYLKRILSVSSAGSMFYFYYLFVWTLAGFVFVYSYLLPSRMFYSLLSHTLFRSMAGPWQIRAYDSHLLVRKNDSEYHFTWDMYLGVVEFRELYLFYGENRTCIFYLPGELAQKEEARQLLEFCRAKGASDRYEDYCREKLRFPVRRQLACFLALYAAATVFLFLPVIL